MSRILATLLAVAPQGWYAARLWVGVNWTVAVVKNSSGEQQVGLAYTPPETALTRQNRFSYGDTPLNGQPALDFARLSLSTDLVEAAVGVATLNALLKPNPADLAAIDAGDWLLEHSAGKPLAVFGRFPFITELSPSKLWVFELEPKPGEYHPQTAADILPNAAIIAITSSTLINHTLDGILNIVPPLAKILLIGPSTPLSPLLFNFGVTMLSGVEVLDLSALLQSTVAGVSFRQMQGTRRVSLLSTT
jgi:uncharacterized protein